MATMTYRDFLRGRPSTPELSRMWDRAHNGGRLYGQSVPGAPIDPSTGLPYPRYNPRGTGYGPGTPPPPGGPAAVVGVPPGVAAPPAPPPPYALPVDPRIESLLMQGRGAVTAGNAGRMALGTNTAFGLTDSGLLERSGAEVRDTRPAGFAEAPDLNNVTYRIIIGPEGRLYRQAYAAIDAGAASRGMGYSSARTNARGEQKKSLDQSVNSTLRGFDSSQNQSLIDQGKGLDAIAGGIADVRFEQAATQAALPVPETIPTPAVSTPASPNATTAAPRPRVLPTVKVIKRPAVKKPVVRPVSWLRTGWR